VAVEQWHHLFMWEEVGCVGADIGSKVWPGMRQTMLVAACLKLLMRILYRCKVGWGGSGRPVCVSTCKTDQSRTSPKTICMTHGKIQCVAGRHVIRKRKA